MGDTCCFFFSMGKIKNAIQQAFPGTYVHSIMIGDNIFEDEIHGFLGDVNSQVDFVCDLLQQDKNLQNGFNAIGFSQGGQFLRAYVERCNNPPVYNLISIGGQHQGVADIPKCTSINTTICAFIEEMLRLGAYNWLVQDTVVQAQYFHDPMDEPGYLSSNKFLPDINNAIDVNQTYKQNIISLNRFVLVKFDSDSIVVPRESEWFGFYENGNNNNVIPYNATKLYKKDTIGIKTLNEKGKLIFISCPGDHLQFTMPWFSDNIMTPFLNN